MHYINKDILAQFRSKPVEYCFGPLNSNCDNESPVHKNEIDLISIPAKYSKKRNYQNAFTYFERLILKQNYYYYILDVKKIDKKDEVKRVFGTQKIFDKLFEKVLGSMSVNIPRLNQIVFKDKTLLNDLYLDFDGDMSSYEDRKAFRGMMVTTNVNYNSITKQMIAQIGKDNLPEVCLEILTIASTQDFYFKCGCNHPPYISTLNKRFGHFVDSGCVRGRVLCATNQQKCNCTLLKHNFRDIYNQLCRTNNCEKKMEIPNS